MSLSFCQKHRSLRRLVGKPERQVQARAEEVELRRSLESQNRVAQALHEYADAMAVAFGKLSELQRTLEAGGLDWIEDAMPLSRALLKGFSEAHRIAKGVADDQRASLEAHRRTLAACGADLAASDAAAEELHRYNTKLDQLSTEEVLNGNSQKGVRRLTRNREKMREAATVLSIKHTRSFDSLQACASRADDLCLLACDVLAGTASALRSAAAHLGGPAAPPAAVEPAQRSEAATALAAVAGPDIQGGQHSPFESVSASTRLLADGAQGCQGSRDVGGWSSARTEYASAARTPDECGSLVSEAPQSPGAPWARGPDPGAREGSHAAVAGSPPAGAARGHAQWPLDAADALEPHVVAADASCEPQMPHVDAADALEPPASPVPPMPQKPDAADAVASTFDLDASEEEASSRALSRE